MKVLTPDLKPKETVDPEAHKLEPVFKKKWIEALRSGKYTQGQQRLRVEDRHCCLGVAEDILLTETGNVWKTSINPASCSSLKVPESNWESTQFVSPITCLKTNLTKSGLIPFGLRTKVYDRVCELVLTENNGRNARYMRAMPKEPDSLAILNDYGASFNMISTIIEEFF